MRAQFAGRPRLGSGAPRDKAKGRLTPVFVLKAVWGKFRDHSQLLTLIAYYAIILAAVYLPVGSELMLGTFVAMIALLLISMIARLANGWRLILIAFCHGMLCLAVVSGLEALDVTGLSKLLFFQITIPLPLAYAWIIDRDERDLNLLEQPLVQ
jgi:hypothetical protein